MDSELFRGAIRQCLRDTAPDYEFKADIGRKEGELLCGSPHRELYVPHDRPSHCKIHNLFKQYKQIGVKLHALFYCECSEYGYHAKAFTVICSQFNTEYGIIGMLLFQEPFSSMNAMSHWELL